MKIRRIVTAISFLIFCLISFAAYHARAEAPRLPVLYPSRIISLNPSITEILFSLKLDDKIVAVTNNCNYPPAAKDKTKIGDMSLNYEKIISLNPDLIIAEGSIFKESLNKLKAMNMPVFMVKCDNIEQLENSFLLIGQKTGKYQLALKLVKNFEAKLNKIKNRRGTTCGAPTTKPKIFVEVWNQPIMTAGKGTFFNDIINIAGGVNIAEKLNKSYPVVNTEFLIKNNPDMIILTTSKPEDIYRNTALKNINAVKNKKVYTINPDIISRPTLRLADAAEQINNWIKTK